MTPEFSIFWALYPRKVARKDAETAWKRLTDEQRFVAYEALLMHVRYWELSGRSKEFVPYGATWLNGERWTDELEIPTEQSDPAWHKTTIGIERKAREIGIIPRPGEDWHTLKARVLAKMKEAA